jgi:uncharacterized protein DUF1016
MHDEINFKNLVRLFERTQSELQQQAARSVDTSLVVRNWLFGWYISEFEQKGKERAQYASKLIKRLAGSLKAKGLKGLSATNLKQFRSFYLCYKTIGQSLPDQSEFTDSKTGKYLYLKNLLGNEEEAVDLKSISTINFNSVEFDGFRKLTSLNSFTLIPKQ